MDKKEQEIGRLLCALAGPVRLGEAEALCPDTLQDGLHLAANGRVQADPQPDFPELSADIDGDSGIRKALRRKLKELDAMRAEHAATSGRDLDKEIPFIPGYARRALLDKDAERFNSLFDTISRSISKEWRRWMEHEKFWNDVLGDWWLGQEYVPEGPARKELLSMLSLRYALLPERVENVLPAKGLPYGAEMAVHLGLAKESPLLVQRSTDIEEGLRQASLAMLHGKWEQAFALFRKHFRTGNTAAYSIAEGVLAPLLVFAYVCAIRVGASRQVIQTWGDMLQGILPAFCPFRESEGMVAFLHNLDLLDGVMNRRTMPSYTPDTGYDLACLPLALCYERLSPLLRRKIKLERLWDAIGNALAQGQMLLGYYAAKALAAHAAIPEDIAEAIQPLEQRRIPPLYGDAPQGHTQQQGPAQELEHLLQQAEDENVELLHWELRMEPANGMVIGIRPRLRTTGEQAVTHELTLNQAVPLCREKQDLAALQLAHMLTMGDAAAMRWISALAGHPRLRLVAGGRRTGPMTLLAEKPVLQLHRADGMLTATLEAREDGMLRHVSGSEWAAQIHSELLESMRELFRLHGQQGSLTMPEAAADMLFSHYDQISRYFDIRGTLSRTAKAIPGECRLAACVQGTETAPEIRLMVRVCAQGKADSPPGEGPAMMDIQTPTGIRSVERDLEKEKATADAMCRDCGLPPHDGRYIWRPGTRTEMLELLARMEGAGVLLFREGEAFRCIPVKQDRLELHAKYMGEEWFELGATLKVDEELVYTLQELLLALEKEEKNFIPVRNGYLHLPEPLKAQLQAVQVLSCPNGRVFGISAAALPALAYSIGCEHLPKELQERLKAGDESASLPPPAGLETELRPYQLQGFRWLAQRTASGIGACLADDMGLGKTVQLIALLLHRVHLGPSLVVSPVSLQANWRQELAKFAPGLRVTTVRSGAGGTGCPPKEGDVVLTSYGQLTSNLKDYSGVPWNVLALDEAQAIKNPDSQRARAVCTLHAAARAALTGTPVENSSMDLWSLMHFLNPLLLGSKARFRRTYLTAAPRYPLKNTVAPLILRRTKAEVLPQLPGLTEQVRYVELGEEERAVYEGARRNALQKLESGQDRISILAELTRLRRACCHARLVLPQYTGGSSKLDEMRELVLTLQQSGHKVLVFSQFTDVLDLVEPLLKKESVPFERLDGSTPARQRGSAVKRFQEGGACVFLISLKAGGTGLNLTAADYVILLDPWWNPAVEAQAAGRSHRIGQTSPVTLYRLIAAHTVEERVLALHQEKKDLAQAILEQAAQGSVENLHALLGE